MSDAGACEPLMELLLEQLRSGPKLQIDETTVQVLKEPVPRLRAAARLETPVLGAEPRRVGGDRYHRRPSGLRADRWQ